MVSDEPVCQISVLGPRVEFGTQRENFSLDLREHPVREVDGYVISAY